MVWTASQNRRQMLVKEDLPVDTAWQEEKRKTATVMEEPSVRLHENQIQEEVMVKDRQVYLGMDMALSCVDPNNNF